MNGLDGEMVSTRTLADMRKARKNLPESGTMLRAGLSDSGPTETCGVCVYA